MISADLVGWLATAASTISFVPQAWKVIRTRETADISIWMYVITVSGFALWTLYGALLGAWPLIATNSICVTLSGFILAMTILPRRKREKLADTLDPDSQ